MIICGAMVTWIHSPFAHRGKKKGHRALSNFPKEKREAIFQAP
jgi:hypothetical protein